MISIPYITVAYLHSCISTINFYTQWVGCSCYNNILLSCVCCQGLLWVNLCLCLFFFVHLFFPSCCCRFVSVLIFFFLLCLLLFSSISVGLHLTLSGLSPQSLPFPLISDEQATVEYLTLIFKLYSTYGFKIFFIVNLKGDK